MNFKIVTDFHYRGNDNDVKKSCHSEGPSKTETKWGLIMMTINLYVIMSNILLNLRPSDGSYPQTDLVKKRSIEDSLRRTSHVNMIVVLPPLNFQWPARQINNTFLYHKKTNK
jgi:hypothetical protein